MAEGRHVAYYRVSTGKQGRSGLGLDAQREAVAAYLNGGNWTLTAEFTEVETGKAVDRPQLAAALAECRLTGATLVVAKLDRLARNVPFLRAIMDSGVGVGFCDIPHVPAGAMGRFTLTQMAAVAELEAGLTSERTKAALAIAKARGVKLGGWRGGPKVDPAAGRAARQAQAGAFAGRVGPLAEELRGRGMSLREIAAELTRRGVRTARDGQWTAVAVQRVLGRGEGTGAEGGAAAEG